MEGFPEAGPKAAADEDVIGCVAAHDMFPPTGMISNHTPAPPSEVEPLSPGVIMNRNENGGWLLRGRELFPVFHSLFSFLCCISHNCSLPSIPCPAVLQVDAHCLLLRAGPSTATPRRFPFSKQEAV